MASSDRRIVRTKKAIRAAFLKLMEESDFHKITITAIAREADIDRKTFYLHYASIDDLADELIQEEADHIIAACREGLIAESEGSVDESVVELFKRISISMNLDSSSRRLISSHLPYEEVLERLERSLTASLLKDDFLGLSSKLGPYLEYCVSFFSAGLVSVARRWLSEDSDIPLEDIAQMVHIASFSGINGMAAQASSGESIFKNVKTAGK